MIHSSSTCLHRRRGQDGLVHKEHLRKSHTQTLSKPRIQQHCRTGPGCLKTEHTNSNSIVSTVKQLNIVYLQLGTYHYQGIQQVTVKKYEFGVKHQNGGAGGE